MESLQLMLGPQPRVTEAPDPTPPDPPVSFHSDRRPSKQWALVPFLAIAEMESREMDDLLDEMRRLVGGPVPVILSDFQEMN